MLDAFSGDTIPMHLVTREALQTYLRKLRPGGLLVFHISNLYLDLQPVLGGLGIAIVSTSRGLMTDKVARREGVGGELLCRVW